MLTAPVVEYKPGPMNHLPVNAQIGIQLFFRLLRALRFDQNPRVLARVVKQIPKLLANMPPLALADDIISNHNALNAPSKNGDSSNNPVTILGVLSNTINNSKNKMGNTIKNDKTTTTTAAATTSNKTNTVSNSIASKTKNTRLGVVDALSHALEITVTAAIEQKDIDMQREQKIVTPESTNISPFASNDKNNSNENNRNNSTSDDLALASIVGLAIKRGSLPQILKAVLLVLAFDTVDKKLKLPVGQYLKELAEAQHVEVEAPLEFGNARGTLMTFGKGDHGKLGHGKCTHPHCSDGNCWKPSFSVIYFVNFRK